MLDRPVFVKCLHPALAKDEEIRARFEREAKAVARLDHPNLVRIYEYGEDPEEGLYMLLEWLDGTTLAARISEGVRYEGEEFTALASQLLSGLSALHGVGILHRDLKPDNILVTEKTGDSGESPRRTHFKITDFSLAALRDAPKLTHHEAIVGTPAYMSPEQAAGGEPDETSDLFSLGVVLYEAATGENPFAGKTMMETLKNVRELEPSFKHPAIVSLPEKARELLFNLLQKDQSARPYSANEGRKLLGDRLPAQEEPATRPPLRLARFLPLIAVMLGFWLVRRWFPGNTQLFNFALLFVVVVGFLIARSPLRHAKPGQIRPRNRKRDLAFLSAAVAVIAFWAAMMLWYPWAKDSGNSQIPNPKSHVLNTAADSIRPQTGETTEIPQENPTTTSNPVEPELRQAQEKRDEGPKTMPSEPSISAAPSTNLPDTVELTLTTEPWAQVFLDGVQLGTTPLGGPVRVPGGSQTLVLRNPAFPPVQVTLNLTQPKARAEVKLAEYTALVRVNVEPWGELYLDGEHVGTTPLHNPLFVSPGHHSVRVSHPQLSAVQQEFQTSAGETLAVNVDLAHGQAVVKK